MKDVTILRASILPKAEPSRQPYHTSTGTIQACVGSTFIQLHDLERGTHAPMTTLQDRPHPSTTSYVIATAILCVSLGYFIGQASSLGLFSSSKTGKKSKTSWPNSYDVAIHPDSSDEELMTHIKKEGVKVVQDSEDEESEEDSEDKQMAQDQGELKSFERNEEECKLVLIVRTDLGMTRGTARIRA